MSSVIFVFIYDLSVILWNLDDHEEGREESYFFFFCILPFCLLFLFLLIKDAKR